MYIVGVNGRLVTFTFTRNEVRFYLKGIIGETYCIYKIFSRLDCHIACLVVNSGAVLKIVIRRHLTNFMRPSSEFFYELFGHIQRP